MELELNLAFVAIYNIKKMDKTLLLSKSRSPEVVYSRYIICHLLNNYNRIKYSQVNLAKSIPCIDRSTISIGIKRVNELLSLDKGFKSDYDTINQQFISLMISNTQDFGLTATLAQIEDIQEQLNKLKIQLICLQELK